MNKTLSIALAAFLLISGVAFSQSPAPGSSLLMDLYAPIFLAGGADIVSLVSPAADVLNPAASGAKQRFTLDFSYAGLVGSQSEGGFGNVINAGVTWPTRVGVLSGSARIVSSPFNSLDYGSFGGINVSFAKDLFPQLLVGLGLGAQFGNDWSLGADLGFVHLAGDLGVFKDFRWGMALRGMGKGYIPEGGYSALPEIFTPSVGVGFGLVDTEWVDWLVSGTLSVPTFQNFRLSIGTQVGIKDRVLLHAGSSFDVRELVEGAARSIPLSFGLSIKFATAIKEDESEVTITTAAAPVHNDIWAVGAGVNIPFGRIDRKAPVISLATDEQYISPNLDGTLDELPRAMEITDERFIKGYKFAVFDSNGQVVREIENKDERPENVTVKNIWSRLTYKKTGITIPEQIRWDGRADNGSVVGDGRYTYSLEAWDDNGNQGRSETGTVVVDNTAPTVEISAEYLIFSPNNDGNKDDLPLSQKGSEELSWQGVFSNVDGQEISSFTWENQEPGPFRWDGRDAAEILAADGVYSYTVSATDRAGNSGSARIDNILINTQATPINITIDESDFSPNNDGSKDTVTFSMDIPVTTGIERWSLSIVDQSGTDTRRVFSGTDRIDKTIVFNGKDDANSTLAEGTYRGHLDVLYVNGNNPTAVSPVFSVDLTPPSASLSSDLSIFSPDGDGIKDLVTIYQETSAENTWQGSFEDLDGKLINEFTWRGRADAKLQWAGKSDDGTLMSDGIYFYSLRAVDKAGNTGVSKKIRFELNTQETEVFVTTDLSHFSPNADGEKDRILIRPSLKVSSGIDSFELRILDQSGSSLRSIRGQNRAPQEFSWDGLNNSGRRVPDGTYHAQLILDYTKGDHHDVRTPEFVVDTEAPEINIKAEYTLFSPDGDGSKDALPFAQESSQEELWEADFTDSSGTVVRSLYWKGAAEAFSWDGKDENGNKIPDGFYTYQIRSTDRAGNTVQSRLAGIEIDTRLTSAFLTVSSDGFSPNNDGIRDGIEFKTYVGVSDGIKSWQLAMVHEQAGEQKVFSGTTSVPGSIAWDGVGGREGRYQARFVVQYEKGNRPEVLSRPFILDTSAPTVTLDVKPDPFSPDNDGVDDELNIRIKVEDLSAIAEWSLTINDPMGNLFYSFSGKGTPTERVIWDGLSNWGELVQAAEDYPLVFSIRDLLGNAQTLNQTVPVDVLVIREGDKLKIRISSITFPPNSPDLAAVEDPAKVLKNQKTMKRLAEILTKYNTYQFRIEGHANNLSWQDTAKAEKEEQEELGPLSLQRAEAVKEALVVLGLQEGRISTAGLGGKNPIVPFSDTENRWKNRRVEFILIKK